MRFHGCHSARVGMAALMAEVPRDPWEEVGFATVGMLVAGEGAGLCRQEGKLHQRSEGRLDGLD